MALSTEYLPTGTVNETEDTYIEGGPEVYFGGELQYAPDANTYYWGITGTALNPVYHLGCYENFQWSDNMTTNDIRCDTVGVVGNITRRNFLEATFDVKSQLPLSQLKILLRWSSALQDLVNDTEYAGIGNVNQQDYHKVYFSKIYDEDTGAWFSVTGHRCQFSWDNAWQFRYGEVHIVGVRLRMYADTDLPSDQRFATVVRYDPTAL